MAAGERTVKVKFFGDAKGVEAAAAQGGKAVDGFGSKVDKLSVGILAAGTAIGVGLAAVGGKFDDAEDTIRLTTGKMGASLDGLMNDFRAVASVVPASFEDVSTVVADLNQRLGLTGIGLQKLAEQELRLAQITGTDVASTVQLTTRLFGDWSIKTEDQAKTLDLLFRASQATGSGVDSLAQTVVQFGAPLRQLGFGLDESLVLLGKWEKEGVNTELVLGGLKKALGTFAKAGKDPVKALRDLIKSLSEAKTTMEANKIAVAALGVKAGPDFAAAVREGRFSYQDLLATVQNGQETIVDAAKGTDDWKESLQTLQNNALITIEPLSKSVFGFLNDTAIPALKGVVDWTGKHETATKAIIIPLTSLAALVLVINGGMKVYAAASAAVVAVTDLWTAAQWALNVALLANPIGVVILAIGAIVLGIGLIVKGLEGLGVSWDDIMGGIMKGARAVGGFFVNIGNKVIRFWNSTIGSFHFTVPSWVPGIGGQTWGLPRLPEMPALAKGGNVMANRPVIVGDAGPEIFFPGRSGRVMSSGESSGLMGGGGDVIVLADFGDGVRQVVRAERVAADSATRAYVLAAAA